MSFLAKTTEERAKSDKMMNKSYLCIYFYAHVLHEDLSRYMLIVYTILRISRKPTELVQRPTHPAPCDVDWITELIPAILPDIAL